MPDETPVTDATALDAPPVEAPAPAVTPDASALAAVAPPQADPAPAAVTPARRRVAPLPPPPVEESPIAAGVDAALAEARETAALVAVAEAAEAVAASASPPVARPLVAVDGVECAIAVTVVGDGCVEATVNGRTFRGESRRVVLSLVGRAFGEVVE